MDNLTAKYYDDNAETLFSMYNSLTTGVERFRLAFPPGSEILDIGCGSGRDLTVLLREQYDAYGIEPSSNLRNLALSNFPQLHGRIFCGALPKISAQLQKKFDGVLCSAVFQHLSEEQQLNAALDIRNLLKPNGRLLLSFPKERSGLDKDSRDENGRLYTKLVPEQVILLFERLGFQCRKRWDDADAMKRPGISWTTLLLSL